MELPLYAAKSIDESESDGGLVVPIHYYILNWLYPYKATQLLPQPTMTLIQYEFDGFHLWYQVVYSWLMLMANIGW